jgi:hypothetical protein
MRPKWWSAVFVTLMLPSAAQPASALTWTVEVVDSLGYVGKFPSIAIDADGFPHISYRNKDSEVNGSLKYAVKTASGAWLIEEPDTVGNVGRHTSLALDAGGLPHISYFDESNLDLKYARGRPVTQRETT